MVQKSNLIYNGGQEKSVMRIKTTGVFTKIFLSLPSSAPLWCHEEDKFSLRYVQSNWLFYAGYDLQEVSFLLYVKNLHLYGNA